MFTDAMIWLVLIGGGAGVAALFAIPRTRPYALKYWWVALLASIPLVGYALLRRRPGNRLEAAKVEGEQISERNTAALDTLVDHARAEVAKADAHLTARRIAAGRDREDFEADVEMTAGIKDSLERREALIRLVRARQG